MALRPSESRTNYRGNVLVTAPATEPVTAAELQTFARANSTTLPDATAEALITRSRQFIEEMTGLAMITQSWSLTRDAWPGYNSLWWDGVLEMASTELQSDRARALTFPRYPLASITSVKTYDTASNETTVTVATTFDIDTTSRPGRMMPKSSAAWPTATRQINAIEITYVAGYGATATDVPPVLRDAVLCLSGYYYDHQGECTMTEAFSKSGAADLVGAYALPRLGVGI